MRSGSLLHRITIQKRSDIETDNEGLPLDLWEDFAAVWAAFEPFKGREYIQAGAENSETTTKIRIRYIAGVTSKMRVLYTTRIFEIVSVLDERERHREMVLECRELK